MRGEMFPVYFTEEERCCGKCQNLRKSENFTAGTGLRRCCSLFYFRLSCFEESRGDNFKKTTFKM